MADTYQVLNLAAIIREVDGSNNKGAAALAESILDHPRFRAVLAGEPAVPESREPVAVTKQPSDEELREPYQGPGTFSPIEYAHDLLARRDNPAPQPPADGEVAELVRTMRMEVAAWNDNKSATYWLSGPRQVANDPPRMAG
ncbi:hypothetical protein EBT31_02065 [bacterium]|nr:hypothetical protein [bacterium]